VKINRHDAEVALRVVNQGNTIPDEHLPYLFNRFYRVDSARTEESNILNLPMGKRKLKTMIKAANTMLNPSL